MNYYIYMHVILSFKIKRFFTVEMASYHAPWGDKYGNGGVIYIDGKEVWDRDEIEPDEVGDWQSMEAMFMYDVCNRQRQHSSMAVQKFWAAAEPGTALHRTLREVMAQMWNDGGPSWPVKRTAEKFMWWCNRRYDMKNEGTMCPEVLDELEDRIFDKVRCAEYEKFVRPLRFPCAKRPTRDCVMMFNKFAYLYERVSMLEKEQTYEVLIDDDEDEDRALRYPPSTGVDEVYVGDPPKGYRVGDMVSFWCDKCYSYRPVGHECALPCVTVSLWGLLKRAPSGGPYLGPPPTVVC